MISLWNPHISLSLHKTRCQVTNYQNPPSPLSPPMTRLVLLLMQPNTRGTIERSIRLPYSSFLTASLSRASWKSLSLRCWYCCSLNRRFFRITSFCTWIWRSWVVRRCSCCVWRVRRFTSCSSRSASCRERELITWLVLGLEFMDAK